MAENNKQGNGDGLGAAAQSNPQAEPGLRVVAQYIKDLSFENPGVSMAVQRPEIDFNVNLEAVRANQDHYEVTLKLRVTASQDEKPIFLLEVAYAGVFHLSNIPDESLQPILFIECPRLLFPFARRIVADMVRDGGMPTLMIEPIDFAALYRAKLAEQASQKQAAVQST